jgi:hypothetical protein
MCGFLDKWMASSGGHRQSVRPSPPFTLRTECETDGFGSPGHPVEALSLLGDPLLDYMTVIALLKCIISEAKMAAGSHR